MEYLEIQSPLLSDDAPLDERSKGVIRSLYAKESAHAKTLPTDHPLDEKRRKRVEATWSEAWEQPGAIRTTLAEEGGAIQDAAEKFAGRDIRRIFITGCGDSWASGIGVRHFYHRVVGVPAYAVQALDFAYYEYESLGEQDLVIALSSSGRTTRTVEAFMMAKAKGVQTLGITNTPGSTLMQEADAKLLVHATRVGWPTQASTAAMALLYRFGIALGASLQLSDAQADHYLGELTRTVDAIGIALERHDDQMRAIAEDKVQRHMYLYAGGGPAYACAFFGAAKQKELTPEHALAIPLEEYHHYRSQKQGDPLFLVAPDGPSVPRALDTARAGTKTGGHVYSLVSEGDRRFDAHSKVVLELPKVDELFAPLVFAAPLHLFSIHSARAKFGAAEAK